MNQIPLDAAAAELHAAAALADHRADGDPFSPWTALGGQLRLVAAGLDPAPATHARLRKTLGGHTAAALERLDELDVSSKPADLAFWRRHVEHLHGQATRLEGDTENRRSNP